MRGLLWSIEELFGMGRLSVVLVEPGENSAMVSERLVIFPVRITGTLTVKGEGEESLRPMATEPADSLTVTDVSLKDTWGGEISADSINDFGISKESGSFA